MNRLKSIRKENGMSQSALAKLLGVAQNTISNWENGNRLIDNGMLLKISSVFDVSTDYILGRDNEKPNKPGETELEDNLIIYQRNGKTVRKKMSKEQMNLLASMIDAIPEDDNPDL